MSTQNHGSTDGTPDPSTPTGYTESGKQRLATFASDSTPSTTRSRTRYGEQMALFSESFVDPWNRMMGQSTDTPEE